MGKTRSEDSGLVGPVLTAASKPDEFALALEKCSTSGEGLL